MGRFARLYFLVIPAIGFLLPFGWSRAAAETTHKYALVLGGGGDPPGPSTIFDPDLKKLGGVLSGAGYQTSVLFDGGHSESENIARSVDPKAEPFTLDATKNKLNKMIHAIDHEMQSGDQLMVVVDTHGLEPKGFDDGVDPLTAPPHYVDAAGSQSFSMEQLAALKKHAKAKGVRLAILDMSCYSGSSLKLADGNTCVVTATAAGTLGIVGFADKFFDRLQTGHSLEQIFLETRQSIPYGKPEISTPAHRIVGAALQNIESEIQFSANEIIAGHSAAASNQPQCGGSVNAVDVQVRRLMKTMSADLGLDTSERFELKKRLVNYLKLRQKVLDDNDFLGETAGYIDDDIPVRYENLLYLDDNLAEAREAAGSEMNQDRKEMAQEIVDSAPQLKRMKADMLKSNSRFAEIADGQTIKSPSNATKEDYQLIRAAGRVSEYERMIYAKLYAAEAHRQTAQGKSNPCKDFKF